MLVHNKIKLLCVFGTFGLKVTNNPVTTKAMGSTLTGPVFFQTFKKCSAYVSSA